MFASQDTQQLISVAITLMVQSYQMMIGSLLVIFVPQDCGGSVCTFNQNLSTADRGSHAQFRTITILFNFVAFFSFAVMYTFEYRRENYLIAHMDVNDDVAQDGKEVGERMKLLKPETSTEISNRDSMYRMSYYISAVLFVVNTILSYISIMRQPNESTTTTFVTSAMFMLFKVIDVYSTTSAEKNVFISAYLKVKLQYNDVDDSVYNRIGLEAKDSNADPEAIKKAEEAAKRKKDRLNGGNRKGGKKAPPAPANQA